MDPCVSLRSRLARVLSHLGLVDQVRVHSAEALARAVSFGHPSGLIYALVQAGLLAIRLGNAPRALKLGDSLQHTVNARATSIRTARTEHGAALTRSRLRPKLYPPHAARFGDVGVLQASRRQQYEACPLAWRSSRISPRVAPAPTQQKKHIRERRATAAKQRAWTLLSAARLNLG